MPQAKHEPGQVQPTPTQEEVELAAIGQNPIEKEHDGSADDPHHPPPPDPDPPDPPDPPPEGGEGGEGVPEARKHKQSQAEQARGDYKTRELTPQPRTPTPRSE